MKTYYELSVTEQDIHRFWKKVNQDGAAPDVNDALVTAPSTACWEWHAARQSNGYGRFFVGGNVAFAHRVAYVIANGPIPRQMVVDHLCRNHACVNPEHVFMTLRASRHGRVTCASLMLMFLNSGSISSSYFTQPSPSSLSSGRGSIVFTCASCSAEYSSELAASECDDADRVDDLRNRQWIAAH